MKRLSKRPHQKYSLEDKLQYRFDNMMAKGGSSILIGLIILIVLSLMAVFLLRIVANTAIIDKSLMDLSDMFWRSLLQIVDAGGIEEDTHANLINKLIGVISVFVGLIFFSALVAFIINQFDIKAESLRKGKSKVIERGHMIILGFSVHIIEIIQQLIIANAHEKKHTIVVLADADKVEMDALLNEEVKERKNTRIITRSGDVCNTKMIQRMSVSDARAVIILNEANVAAVPAVRDQGDEKALETIIAVVTAAGNNPLPPIVAQFHSDKTSQMAESIVPGKITVIDTNDILARILVNTSLNPGLAFVYSRLVGFQGYEMYFYRPRDGWQNHPFSKLQFHFIISVLLGFRTPDGSIILNPRLDFVPDDDYDGIFLAGGPSQIKLYKKQLITPKAQKFFMKKSRIVLENQLIIGWNSKILLIIDEYSKSIRDSSMIDVVVKDPTRLMTAQIENMKALHSNIKLSLINGDVHSFEFLSKLSLEKYDNVVILAEESDRAHDADLKTISRLMSFRHFMQTELTDIENSAKPKLVTEVIDSDKTDIFFQAGARDFVIPHKFVSEIVAQISQQPDVKRVYDSIFQLGGNAIYVKSVDLFFKEVPVSVSFADCILAAQIRGEVCLGIKIADESTDIDKNYGIYMPTYKNMIFDLDETDALITLAENRN